MKAGAAGREREPFVFFVTFPRSGHHYLVDLLQTLFPFRDEYCEFYHCLVPGCPVAGLPGMFRAPCHSGRRFQKHHDFGLDLPLAGRCRYVVQYRYPLESLVSLFEFRLKHGYAGLDAAPPVDSAEGWRRASEADAAYWRRFAKKWLVRPAGQPNLLACRYEEVTAGPAPVLAVLHHIGRGRVGAEAILDRHFTAQRTFDFRSVERFRYFDRDHFSRLERDVIGYDLLRRVGYAPRFA